MKTYRYAIFDLDGTLLDTSEDLADSVNHALAVFGLKPRTLEEVKQFIGNGVANLISLSAGSGADSSLKEKVLGEFRLHYADNMANKTKPFDGIIPLLETLKQLGVGVAVSSNKFQQGVEELCMKYFPGLYTAAFGEREGIARKPDPAIVFTALGSLGAKPEETLYIGDSEVDGETAKNAGIDFVGVSWGLRPVELLLKSGAEFIVDNPGELRVFFQSRAKA